MDFNDLSPELKEKARTCSSEEELAELVKAIGVELSDDEVTAVAAGMDACVKDVGCSHYVSRKPCPSNISCSDLFDCLTRSCTEFYPINCTDLFDQLKQIQCRTLGTS